MSHDSVLWLTINERSSYLTCKLDEIVSGLTHALCKTDNENQQALSALLKSVYLVLLRQDVFLQQTKN